MGVNLSEFKSVEMNMTAPRTWTIEQVKDWLTECFGLNPEVHTVGVHALWTKSITNILWYLRPVDDTSKWVSWLKGSERRGTNPVALVLPVAKEVAPPEGGYSGGGGYESGQSSQAPGGGGGYEPEQSSHAEDVYSGQGDGYSGEDGEVDGDEENGYRQNQMEEEDTEGESDAGDSDESDDGEEVPIPGRWNHNFSSAMTINDGLDSNWEYHQNNVAVGAMFPSKRHMQDAIIKWAMASQRQLRTTVSSGKYLTMECVDINCPGRVHGYVPKYDTTWRVSDFVPHSCELASIRNDHCNLSSNLIARLLYTEIVEGQAMRVNAIQKNVKKHHFYTISYGKAWRAKQRAMEMRFGSFRDAYDAVVRLLQTLQARNPDTYVNIQDMFLPEFPSYRRRFARDQVRNCYPAFTEQFDVLDDRAVIWEPYTAAAVHARYPGGISILCYRDCAYWMTQSKIIFDVSVEVMAQQRIMRQFGSRQLVDPPPPIAPLPAYVHKYNRKGTSHSSTWWLQRVGSYVDEWLTATTHLWRHDEQFDPQEFEAYLQRYTAAARVRLIPPIDPAEAPPPSMYDMYPTQSTAGSRQHAGQMTSDLHDEVARYTRQVSSGPLLQPRDQQVSWLRRLEEKLRGIYSAITCSRSSDVVQRHLLPPRPSTRHDPRPRVTPTATPRPPPPDRPGGSSWQQQHTPSFDDFHGQQHGSRPRLTPTATPRPPPPEQAGGSSWQQQQHTPSFDDFHYYQQQAAFDEWQQQQAPFMGGGGYSQGYTQHTASNPSWGASDQDTEHMEYYSTQQNYVGMQTPPPLPTQETQYDPESGSWIPARNVRPPDRFGWTPRGTPPPRQPRLRRPPG
ncbi:hypothetical protein QYE76_032983 [Lolium multiflorum]|uniref:Transposase MuDR plant domain-containing protein n=1 Tax=Lolium multiflorum TaxID=4521 RepID=A0AAD8QVU2_LOLMU|nr:hypothetical protein QYE76_032983 [Lolium multiflorum]